jgi:hypothetical protein
MRTTLARRHVALFVTLIAGCSAVPPPAARAGGAKDPPEPSLPAPTAKHAAKISPDMVGTLSPIPAMMAHGEGWTFEMQGTQGMEHHAVLLFQNGNKRFEGTLVFRDSTQQARGAHQQDIRWMRFDGELSNDAGNTRTTLMVGDEACTDREGRTTRHTLRFVLGREEFVGCADLAMY